MIDPKIWDVAICGGGLAGLTLARQLRRELPDLSVVVLEKLPRPLPPAAFKVGESSVELSARYFGSVLGLKAYLRRAHLPKLGLRFFFGDSRGPLKDRPELGESRFPPIPSYQLDRGVLEEDLRGMLVQGGARLLEDSAVDDIILDGRGPHEVRYRLPSGPGALRARWVIDATGRRRLLQAKLGLKLACDHRANAAWFRVSGRLDVDDLVPSKEKAWHGRVPGRQRFFSTNHLLGKGYWVWLIPLSSGATSIGIVADEALHPFREYATYGAARAWLKLHEPVLDAYLGERPILDFRKLKQFSHASSRVFSPDRWACTGEAGVFTDPLYSPGSDFIAVANSMIVRLIGLDRGGKPWEEAAEGFNRLYLGLFATTLDNYRNSYSMFGHAQVATAKILWDYALYWGYTAPLFFQGKFSDPALSQELFRRGGRILALHRRAQRLFQDWAARVPPRETYSFMSPKELPFLARLHKSMPRRRAPNGTMAALARTERLLEDMAQVFFRRALLEADPARAAGLDDRLWLDSWAVGLDPARWEDDGLFRPRSRPRDLRPLQAILAPVWEPARGGVA